MGKAGRTGLEALDTAQVLDCLLTTGDVPLLLSTGTQLGGTLVQAASAQRSVLQESGTFSDLGLNIMARMGRDHAGEACQASDESGSELNHGKVMIIIHSYR
jgi:hypothetical protein